MSASLSPEHFLRIPARCPRAGALAGGDYSTANLAMPVITLLGWRTYDDDVADMRRFS